MKQTHTQMLQGLGAFSVSQISDVLGFSHPVETGLHPLDPLSKICGKARTVLCEPDDNLAILHALDEAEEGDVLVISCSSPGGAAVWGEVLSFAAQCRGVAGTIVDGAVRDVLEVNAMGYPVFARCLNARRARKEKAGERNIPVRCGSIVVRPGEIVLADTNGIVSVEEATIPLIMEKVAEVSRKEAEIKEQLSRGLSILDILKVRHTLKPNA